MPVGPGSHVENARQGLLQHFATFVFADDPSQRLQILDGAEHHDVGKELHWIGKRPFRLLKPYDAPGDRQTTPSSGPQPAEPEL